MALVKDDLNFLQFLSTFRRGDLVDDCNLKLNELMEAIAATGKGGKLELKFDFKIAKGGHLEVTATPKLTKPVQAIPPGIYFVGEDNGLARRDPRQMDIEDEIERRRSMDA
mgnify:CR=1 FL=1